MISTTNVPLKTPSGNCPRPFKAQDITSTALSTATSADASTAVTTTLPEGSLTIFNASLSPREQTLMSAKESLQTVTDVAEMALQHFKEKGLPLDESAALQFALEQQQGQEMIHHQRQQEVRHYMWEAHKLETQERRHQENLETAREDKNWLSKLKNARDESVNTLVTAIQHGMLLAVAWPAIVFVYSARKNWNEFTISGPFSHIQSLFIGQCLNGNSVVIDNSSWWGYASTYVTSYVPSLENINCMALRIYWLIALVLAVAALGLLSFCIKNFLSSTVGRVVETALLGALLMILSWTWIPWAHIAIAQASISVPVFIYLQYMFQVVKHTLRKDGKIPSSSEVNKSIVTFDKVTQVLQVTPLLILLTSIIFAA